MYSGLGRIRSNIISLNAENSVILRRIHLSRDQKRHTPKSYILLSALEHIVDLDLGQTEVRDTIFEVLQQLKNLAVLKLNQTAISDKGIE